MKLLPLVKRSTTSVCIKADRLEIFKTHYTVRFTHLSQHSTVHHFEDLVEAELPDALHRVAEERRRPSLAELSHATFPDRHAEPVDDVAVLGGVDLHATFDEIKGHDGRVCQSAAEQTSKGAVGEELWAPVLAAVRLCKQ